MFMTTHKRVMGGGSGDVRSLITPMSSKTPIITGGRFSVQIVAPGAQLHGDQYVALRHETEYSLRLTNNYSQKADADLMINERHMGKFRVPSHSSVTIERPAGEQRKFTFLKEDSPEAGLAGTVVGASQNGTITVIFYPEKPQIIRGDEESGPWGGDMLGGFRGGDMFFERGGRTRGGGVFKGEKKSRGKNQSRGENQSFSSGTTALGNHSSQTFRDVPDITDIDTANVAKIVMRLICNDGPKYRDVSRYDDLSRLNKILPPPRVEDL
jgi:hypothetical protein